MPSKRTQSPKPADAFVFEQDVAQLVLKHEDVRHGAGHAEILGFRHLVGLDYGGKIGKARHCRRKKCHCN